MRFDDTTSRLRAAAPAPQLPTRARILSGRAFVLLVVAMASCWPPVPGLAAEPVSKRLLVIGIDGCRPDAIHAAVEATTLHTLIREGAFSNQADVLGDRNTGADTSTGPGWSSALTGVWADKHQVRNNLFLKNNLKEHPTLFHRVQSAHPEADVSLFVSWPQFHRFLFAGLKGCKLVLDGDENGYAAADHQVTAAAEKQLAQGDPRALFVYYGEVDITGHGYGFHPKSPKYTKAIEAVDVQIARVLKAMRARPAFAREDWLTIVCTDHGGRNREHGLGDKVPEIRTGFIILHGPSVTPGAIKEKTNNVDVTATALKHLGITIDPEWKLDGRPIGLKQ